MFEYFSPDGQIGSPLQAIGFLGSALLGTLLMLHAMRAYSQTRDLLSLFAAFWRLDTLALLALSALVVLNLFHHAIAPLDGVFRPEIGDGGLVENLTILVMLFPAVIFFGALLRGNRQSELGVVFMSLVSFVLIFAFGEEISWGQHWFGFDIPESIAQTNLQEEINLHNYIQPETMELIYFIIGMALLLIAANLQWLFKASRSDQGFLALKTLLILSSILMTHHIFQELAELAVIVTGFLIWARMNDGRMKLRPTWLKALASI